MWEGRCERVGARGQVLVDLLENVSGDVLEDVLESVLEDVSGDVLEDVLESVLEDDRVC